jgi:hypothetical protein
MPSLESTVKSTFAKYFVESDWKLFKSTADYYFRRSSQLKRADIDLSGTNALLIRNIQKRLFLGIGAELLLKAFFLKEGYLINKPKNNKVHGGVIHLLNSIPDADLHQDDTFSFGNLVDNLHRISAFTNHQAIKNALIVLKVFRNKEGHVVTRKHSYDASVYRSIENGLQLFYNEGFSELLSICICMEPRENGKFIIRRL